MRAIIFDMDGVLLDSEPIHDRASKRVFGNLRGAAAEDIQPDLLQYRGRTEKDMWEHLRVKYGLKEDLPLLVAEKQKTFIDVLGNTQVRGFAHMEPVIAKFSEKYFLAVASSSSRRVIEAVLDRLGVLYLFPIIVSGDDVARGKPEPDIFLLAADRLGIDAKDCVVIEDSTNGVRAGKAAGIRTIAFCPDGKNAAADIAGEFVTSYPELLQRLA
jgi:HAD superfamily hydrolase (TIGR01509 family)